MLLEARNIVKQYYRNLARFFAVNDVSLSIGEGEFVCVSGRSGSGKSTLINILAGLLSPTSGSVIFDGLELERLNDDELSLLRNTRIGYIMQGHSVLQNFTALQNVMLPRAFHGSGGDQYTMERAISLLEQTGIRHLASQYPRSLSGGELRRVSIARALLPSPGLLLADEPTADLDEETAGEITRLFKSISEAGTAILMVTHDSEAATHCDRRYVMASGKISGG
jgi:putative ABC transport system ATP-binding protein